MTEDLDPEVANLRLDEVPLCFGALARFGNAVVGADCLVSKLAAFECVADCDNCIVADAINNGTEIVDMVAGNIVKAVRTLQSAGKELIGWNPQGS